MEEGVGPEHKQRVGEDEISAELLETLTMQS